MASLTTVRLNKGDSTSWGFRLQGGKDFGTPLVIQKVNGGSPAERAGLSAGDAVIKINHVDVYNLLHKEAQDVIVRSGPSFEMVIQRGGSTWKPLVVPTGKFPKPSPVINNVSPVTKTYLAATRGENIGAIGTGHNLSAQPFSPQVNGTANGGPKLVNKQYNSPLKLYSEDSIAETLSAQTEVLSTGALGVNFKKNEKDYDVKNSAVYRMLQEAENDSNPHSNEPEPDSGIVTAPNRGMAGLRHVQAPQTRPAPSNPQVPTGQNICAECERLIVGVFVRIKEKNLHVECFKCSTCGSSLKNVGYYNINNKLYCDVHAKLAAINNPPGSGLLPDTVPFSSKAPTSAISAALSSHSLPSPSALSPKTTSFSSPYQPAEEISDVDGISSVPVTPLPNINSSSSSEPNIKPSSNSSIFNNSIPLSFSTFITKPPGNFSGPKPFSSVSAPLSPGGTLPRAAPLSPQSSFPSRAPLSPSAPSYTSYSPASTAGRSTNITWPPTQEESDIPTACSLFYPPPSKVEAELEEKRATRQFEFENEYFTEENLEDINMDETTSFYSEELCFSGRRSATECVEMLSETLETQKFVEEVIKGSPLLVPPALLKVEKGESMSLVETNGFKTTPLPLPNKECIQNNNNCDLKRPMHFAPDPMECKLPSKIENAVPQKWESTLTQAVRTVPPDPDTFSRIPTRHSASPLVSALAIAPVQPFNPMPQHSLDPVSLPEETEPYFPPEHPVVSAEIGGEQKKDEKASIKKPKSMFVKALEITPERSFTSVGSALIPDFPSKKKPKDLLDKLFDDLPKPNEKLDMRSALTTAPERPYTPLVPISEGSVSSKSRQQKSGDVDRSLLNKPLKPEELPTSFKMHTKEPKPPSYYPPSVIEEHIKSQSEESTKATENKEKRIIEKEIIHPAEVSQHIITTQQEPQPSVNNFPPIFQGFTCSFQNKTDHSQFSVEISTTPPVPTPPPKPQTPTISYIATVEQKPGYITREKIIEETIGLQQKTRREESFTREKKVQNIEKQAEEVIQVKPLPVSNMLRKPEGLPHYQLDLQATAEADLLLIEKKQKALERHEQRKVEIKKEEQEISQKTQTIQSCGTAQQDTLYHKQQQQFQELAQTPARPPPTKPSIIVQSEDSEHASPIINFQPVIDEHVANTTLSLRPRSITPSMINKALPLLPYYQDNLVAHYHAPVESNLLDPRTPERSRSPSPNPEMHSRSPSPFPIKAHQERAKSPAQGPPPNPLHSSKPLPSPEDSRVRQAKESLKTFLPDYKAQRDLVKQVRGTDCCQKGSEIGQQAETTHKANVAYSTVCSDKPYVQTGTVQQNTSCEQHIADEQKAELYTSQTVTGISVTDVLEKSHHEHLAASLQSQSESSEKSTDGLSQIQRKHILTEEYERNKKQTNVQIQKNVTSTKTYPFTNVSAPPVGNLNVQGIHVTNPSSVRSRGTVPIQKHSQRFDTQNTLQQASQKLESCQKQCSNVTEEKLQPSTSQPHKNICIQSELSPPQPPIRHVFAPGSLLPIKHVTAPGACQKPTQNVTKPSVPKPNVGAGTGRQAGGISIAPKRGRGVLNAANLTGSRVPLCGHCRGQIRGPFITALGKIWCPQHFTCATPSCRRPLQDLGFVEEKGQLHCEYCFEQYLAPPCSKCSGKIKGDCLKAIGKNFHPECFNCVYCGKLFANSPFFLEDGSPYCEADWNELFTTKCYACGFPVEAGDRWVEALSNNYHSQCFNCTMCKKNLEGQSFFAKGGRPFCKNHAR